MTDTPRKDGPRTEAGRADHEMAWQNGDASPVSHEWEREGCEGCAFIARIEAEAAAGPHDEPRYSDTWSGSIPAAEPRPAGDAALREALDSTPLIVGRLALGKPTGACLRACLATITGLDVPDIDGPGWFDGYRTFLAEHGWTWEPNDPLNRSGFAVAVGEGHAVVALDGEVIWDPGTGKRTASPSFRPYAFCRVFRAALATTTGAAPESEERS